MNEEIVATAFLKYNTCVLSSSALYIALRLGIFSSIPCIYNNMFWGFSDGLCAVQNDMEKWGFINKSGELVVDYLYDEVEQYRDGLALCRVNGEKIYIDKDGNEVFNFEI